MSGDDNGSKKQQRRKLFRSMVEEEGRTKSKHSLRAAPGVPRGGLAPGRRDSGNAGPVPKGMTKTEFELITEAKDRKTKRSQRCEAAAQQEEQAMKISLL